MEEQKKTYDELNVYERTMVNVSLEQKLEAMAKELSQMALALKHSIHVNATFHDWDTPHTSCTVFLIKDEKCVKRDTEFTGDLFGIIEEAMKAKEETEG